MGLNQTALFFSMLFYCGVGLSNQSQHALADSLFRYEFSKQLMGTQFRILLYAKDSAMAASAAEAGFNRVAELELIFSDYLEGSEASILNSTAGRGGPQKVSPEMWRVLTSAMEVSQLSNGAFDVSTGALTKLWRKAFRQNKLPELAEINDALATTGYKAIRLNYESQTVEMTLPGMRLDFGGIAKGYAVDAALAAIKSRGIFIAMIDGGGDLAAGKAPPGAYGWKAEYLEQGKKGPETSFVYLQNQAIATSGRTNRYLEWNGKRYSHIIDPRTGYGITTPSSTTVFAPTCLEADAWATAASVGISDVIADELLECGIRICTVK